MINMKTASQPLSPKPSHLSYQRKLILFKQALGDLKLDIYNKTPSVTLKRKEIVRTKLKYTFRLLS